MDTNSSFIENTSIIRYNQNNFTREKIKSINDLNLDETSNSVVWANTYGLNYNKEIEKVGLNNNLDDFMLRMLLDDIQLRNKLIEFSNSLFLTLKVTNFKEDKFEFERMVFIIKNNSIWSIQEFIGDYFEDLRTRIEHKRGVARKKNVNYLLFLIIESIIDQYAEAYEYFSSTKIQVKYLQEIKPNQRYVDTIESNKENLFVLKKAVINLRETLVKLEAVPFVRKESHYFTELKEQANSLLEEIDFDMQQLESKLNLVFNMQNDRLNQVMKTLTIFSVIFIPLTFIAGIYGMNFKNIPELESEHGYYIVLFVMFIIAILLFFYFKKKKWF